MAMGGQSAEQLQQHARNAFEASEKLLGQAANGGGESERFYRAANRYATTLRTLGGASAGRGGAGGGVSATTTSGTGADTMSGVDLTSVTLINHGVKEALDSLQLKQMVRMMGRETAAGRALMDHARQMDAESRQAIDALAMGDGSNRPDAIGSGGRSSTSDAGATGATGAGTAGVGRTGDTGPGAGASITPGGAATAGGASGLGSGAGAGGGRGAAVQQLVQQSREVLQAIRELDGDSGERGAGREGSGSGRNASGAGNTQDRPR